MEADTFGSGEQKTPVFEGYKFLAVDDEPDELRFIAAILEDNGATVILARDGIEALDLARREKPDLITLDLNMPGKNGVDVYIELKKDPELKQIRVCIITGRPELRKLIYDTTTLPRPEGYINKPVNEKQLVLNIRKIMEVGHRHPDK